MTSGESPARPSNQHCQVGRLRDRRLATFLGILAVLVTTGVSVLVLYTSRAFATTPGLYGGTLDNSSCDPRAIVSFLRVHPDKAKAWASVQGITPSDIPAYVAALTPLILRADTPVTNHGFSNGSAPTVYSVLEPGTAVLVDKSGFPRVICYCGNPVIPPGSLSTDAQAVIARQRALDFQTQVLRDGHLVYRPPSPMRQGDWQRIVVRVAGPTEPPDFKTGLPGTGPVVNHDVKVGSDLTAYLTGPDFEIKRVGGDDGARTLATEGKAEWSWDVRPWSSGQKSLTLTLYVRLLESGAPIYVKTFDEKIDVKVNPVYALSKMAKDYWAATGLTIPVIIGGFLVLVKLLRKRTATTAKNAPADSAKPGSHPDEEK